jgi:hypothetical protein
MTTSHARQILWSKQPRGTRGRGTRGRKLTGGIICASLLFGTATGTVTANAASKEPEKKQIIAQSTEATAATGRLWISARIALARKPVQRLPKQEEVGLPADQAAAQTVDARTTSAAISPPASDTPAGNATGRTTDERSAGGLLYPSGVAAGLPASTGTASTSTTQAEEATTAPAAIRLQVVGPQQTTSMGTPLQWRLQLRNTGGMAARNVSAMLFFADGLEPVAASGGPASLAAGEVRFDPLDTVAPGETIELLVTGLSTAPGSVAYRAEVVSSDLEDVPSFDGRVSIAGPAAGR